MGYYMKKILLWFLFTATLNAGLINAIAVVVNDTPITLYDIDELMENENLSHNQAVSVLIDKVLYEELLKQNDVKLKFNELDNYVEKLALSNGMTTEKFKKVVSQQENYDVFLKKIEKRLITQKLISKIAIIESSS